MTWQPDNRVALENDGARLEIVDKITGKAKYTTDYYPEGMLWAGYLRCPYGKARLRGADIDAARAIPGVLEAEITREEGRYAGERMGHVCAESREALERARRAVAMQWDIETPSIDLTRARTPFEEVADPPNQPRIARALGGATYIHEQEYETQVQTHTCLEPHIGLVDYRGDHALAWGSTQGTFSFRNELAEALDLSPDAVEFNCEHVGGGFGSKFGMGAEGELAARMSKKYGRPCRVGLDRKEEHLDAGLRPGSRQYMRAGVNAEGELQAARIHTWGSVGFSGGGGGVSNPGRYRFGIVGKSHEDVHLNSGFPRAMRSPGHPQGMFAVELFLDEVAAALDIDPIDIRRANDRDDVRKAMLDAGAGLIGWERRQPNGAGAGTLKRGFGIGVADWMNMPGAATVDLDLFPNGAVEVRSGAQDIGTGFRTLLADCVASVLGAPRDRIKAKVGRSSYPPGPASGGSVTSRFAAPKAMGAARRAREALLELVAEEWGVAPDALDIAGGRVTGPGQTMDWAEACGLIPEDRLAFRVNDNDEFWRPPTSSQTVQFVELTVDVETGIVRVEKVVALQEVGLPVNRHACENQITGGVIQGLSFALFENRLLSRHNGAMLNPNMDMYKIAGPADVPEIVTVLWRSQEDPAVNSLGEPPVIPTPGAIACAVYNAIGVPVRSLPITPDKVLAALDEKGAQA